ncbi:alpha/beta hydrolase [Rhodopseudomonas boonkerdii]|uniref:alpha/beta fold hydrolase n=1 Tax=Rhodopseudomonas boonkerdii TaxID=475937 RepID=UPI001E5D6DFD|nr:alpha/beta hydrolase [Rhodopseudomonas boonkerdii]UGV25149.1 alpha/beta hydrolase [Rhodopseudomonas boonkerdii]
MTYVPSAPVFPVEKHAFDVVLEDGASASVRVYGSGPRVICSHGNGLAADAFRSFWQLFIGDYETVVFDFRHHGRSSPYTKPIPHVWPQLIRDYHAIMRGIASEIGAAPSLGAFHSMSALTTLLHASEYESPWIGIVGFEPPAKPPQHYPEFEIFRADNNRLGERAIKRRYEFNTVQELFDSYRRSSAFAGVDDAGLQALAASTLRWNVDKQLFELACAREFEASIFAMQDVEGAWERMCGIRIPVQLVAGEPKTGTSPFMAIESAFARDGGFAFTTVKDATHFMQMEKPEECAAIVRAFHARL